MASLARDEREVLDGKHGRAEQRAVEILVLCADALGAEWFINTNNVYLLVGLHPYPEPIAVRDGEELASRFLLAGEEKIVVDYAEAFNTTHIFALDLEVAAEGSPDSLHEVMEAAHSAFPIAITGRCRSRGWIWIKTAWGDRLIYVEIDMSSVMDWYLLGYYVGEKSQLSVPVINLKYKMVPT